MPARLFAPLIAVGLSLGLAAQMRTMASTENAEPFHKAVRDAVDAIPVRVGDWEGKEKPAPAAAGTLLHPNKMFGMQYLNARTGRWATLILVHCKDSRDMSGHYPPNCYRGSGWTQVGPPKEQTIAVWGRRVPIAEYGFTRSSLQGTVSWAVYDLFVLPAGGICTDMRVVQKAGGDYRSRPYGAAQIQVIVDQSTPQEERAQILDEMLSLLGPVVQKLQLSSQGASR